MIQGIENLPDETLVFPSEVNRKIEIALEQVKNGNVSTQAEADEEIEKWLNAKGT